jgi:5S rRNA maturation endonuclease (ribonuclease M5)
MGATPMDTFAGKLEVRNGMARCPAHEDRAPSLSVTEGDDGRVLLHCHAGCSTEAVTASLGLAVADLFPPKAPTEQPRIVATYPYTDADGSLLYEVVRRSDKSFRQRRPDGRGGYVWKLDGVDRVLYRLPAVLEAVAAGELVYVTEGEKDADALVRAGVCATTAPQGAGNWHHVSSHARDVLAGAVVVVVPDIDKAGQAHGRDIVRSLRDVATVTVAHAAVGKDAADHLAAGHAVTELVPVASDRIRDVPDLADWLADEHDVDTNDPVLDDGVDPFPVLSIGEMARRVDAAPPAKFIVRRLLVEGDYGVMGATKKFGKTFAMGDLAVTVAAGGSFLGQYPVDRAGPVLLFAGEGGQRKIVRRCRAIAAHHGIVLDDLPLYVYERAPKLADLEQVARLAATVEQIRPVLVIVDPAYLAVSGAETYSLTSMGTLLERAQLICQSAGSGLIVSHHWNKTGQGSTADRFTGSGWAEWGRVLISGSTLSTNHDTATGRTNTVCKLEVIGDEIGDTEILYRREVWVDDPDDLASPMHYVVTAVDPGEVPRNSSATGELAGMAPAAVRVLGVLRGRAAWLDYQQIGDELAETGIPLKKRTILDAGQALVGAGFANESGGVGGVRKTFRAVST